MLCDHPSQDKARIADFFLRSFKEAIVGTDNVKGIQHTDPGEGRFQTT